MLMIPSCRSACQRPNHRRMRPSWLPLTYAVNAVHINGWGPTDWNWDAKKTQLIWIRTGQQLAKLTVTQLQLINSVVELDSTATNLGVVLDGQLSVSQQVTAVCRSCFYQLRQLKSVKSSLTREALHSLIQAFVHCRIEYCNWDHLRPSHYLITEVMSHWTFFNADWKLNCSSVLTTDTAPVKRLYCCMTHFHFSTAFCCGHNLEVYRLKCCYDIHS